MQRRAIVSALILSFSAVLLQAQSENATMTGSVQDPTGAVISRAEIAVRNEGTGATAQTRTNDEGLFNFSSLRPGTYTLTAASPGFKGLVRSGITLHVNQSARLDVT